MTEETGLGLTDSDGVFYASGNYDVGDVSLRFDVFVEIGLHISEPLFYAAIDVATAMFYVSEDFDTLT